ncbi:MAG: DUF3127 domain-containing protein [Porphyromonadaceae bacterium]|nr:MAG: DUF3127 domain-containing protein [Porphyromonadaceae bacterium]
MEIIGKIILKLPLQTGVSKAGNNWSKQEYVLETQENFPKKVHFDFFGDRATQYDLQEGQMVKLSFDIESREYNGRWYTSIRGWKRRTSRRTGSSLRRRYIRCSSSRWRPRTASSSPCRSSSPCPRLHERIP